LGLFIRQILPSFARKRLRGDHEGQNRHFSEINLIITSKKKSDNSIYQGKLEIIPAASRKHTPLIQQ
jgi:hypothetical protein